MALIVSAKARQVIHPLMLVVTVFIIWILSKLLPTSETVVPDLTRPLLSLGDPDSGQLNSHGVWTFDQCTPVKNVFYLRIHKTASSTITTMLYRRALRQNLSIVLTRGHPFVYTSTTDSLFTYPRVSEHPTANLFTEHAMFNFTEIKDLLPTDAIYVTSVRDPLTHITSVLGEFPECSSKLSQRTVWPNMTEYFLDNLQQYGTSMRWPTKSLMARMMGVPDKDLDNLEVIQRVLRDIDRRFALVSIKEYFDESLIVLRRKLCWEMADIVYLPQRVAKKKTNALSALSEERYRNWSHADFLLHQHFTDKLWFHEVPRLSDFWDEVHALKKINKLIAEYCTDVLQKFISHDSYFIVGTERFKNESDYLALDPRPWGEPFFIRPLDCAVMRMGTTVVRNIFKVRQIPQLCTLDKTQKITSNLIKQNIDWVGDKVRIHPDYCLPAHPKYGFPIEILTHENAYLKPIF